MLQSATFDKNGISIENTDFNGKSVSVDCSEFIQEKLTDNTFGERLRKSRLELGLSIPEVAKLCNVTKSVISGYECNRINPTKDILELLSSKFDMDYLCMEGYTKLIYNFDEFLYKLNLWIEENILLKKMQQVSLVYLVDFLDFGLLIVVLLALVHITKLRII